MSPYTFGVVGNGWRAGFYHRIARALPESLRATGVATSRIASADAAGAEHGIPGHVGIADLIAAGRPDFVVVSVPRESVQGVVVDLVERGVHVLLETPPAADLPGLRSLWSAVGASGLVQVAEQYPRYPGHAARRAIVDRGVIGAPTGIQVSSTHDYHAVALIRSLLDARFERAQIRAAEFSSELVDPMGRDAWTDDEDEMPASTVLATIDFGGAMGLYDFTSNQWHNQLRHRRIVVRGSRGEIVDDHVVHLAAPRTIVESSIARRQLGYDLDLDGYATDHLTFEGEVVWRNPFPGTRFSDEELAIADLLLAAGAAARDGGPDAYSLADASQDHAIALGFDAALASGGTAIVEGEPWTR